MKKNPLIFLFLFLAFSPLVAIDSLPNQSYIRKFKIPETSGPINIRRIMARITNDVERVDAILIEYKKLTRQVNLPKKTWNVFEKWLCKKSFFLGSPYYDHNLVFEELPELEKNLQFQEAYQQFVSRITVHSRDTPHTKARKNITILFNGCAGGGHKSPAVALAQHFQSIGHKVQIIDIDQIENLYSPKIAGYTRPQIYAEIYQKQGNAKKARELCRRIEEIHPTKKRKYMGDLKKKISDFQADHIFAVAHHRPHLSYLSFQLGTPMTYVHTDHIFNKNLIPLVVEQTKLKKPLLSFSAITDRNFLKSIFTELQIKNEKLPRSIQRQLVKLDIPVRSSFSPVTKKRLHLIRDSLNIPRNAIVCELAMGQNGITDEIKDILKQLILEEEKYTFNLPVHVFVICGSNALLKSDIEKLCEKSVRSNSQIHIHPCGFLEEREMAQIAQVSDVWITKPGGSTTAELVQTRKQMLYVITPHHSWELTNAKYLEKLSLAEKLSMKRPLIKQIEKRLESCENVNFSSLPKCNWKYQANQIILRKSKD